MTLSTDLQSLAPSAIIELLEIDLTPLGGSIMRVHNGTSANNSDIVWQGNTYSRFPIEVSGFEFSAKGQLPRPILRVANVNLLMGTLAKTYQDFLNVKVTRKRTLAKYLDAVNYPAGNPTADPLAELPDDIYFIDRKASENKILLEFELAAASDVSSVQLPRRYIIQNVCPWKYRGSECGYTGTNYYDANNNLTGASTDSCSKELQACKLRFGNNAELPFGGFPGAGLIR